MPQDYESKYDVTSATIDEALTERIGDFIIMDETGQATKDMATHARTLYLGLLEQRRADPRSELDVDALNEAASMALGFAPGEFPELNGVPTVPFEEGMPMRKMKKIWDQVTTEDFEMMNNGGVPGVNGKGVPFNKLKEGFLIYREPGVYQIGIIRAEQVEVVMDEKTSLPYEFNYRDSVDRFTEREQEQQYAITTEQL